MSQACVLLRQPLQTLDVPRLGYGSVDSVDNQRSEGEISEGLDDFEGWLRKEKKIRAEINEAEQELMGNFEDRLKTRAEAENRGADNQADNEVQNRTCSESSNESLL
mmetsp:Transcript_82542/g.129950  ORF Transcript_82542/g.129950 Transcript_82542/m.129950 type:complete len:107 (-) Transcript_82542:194-514(-)|eukprot:CAMPEP_0169176300 /NCGR_PEP_ID=MMETSP1015-20121227/65795_1 /TAXON_ID=342587 /ORGANISM="Karlodinium micrum, Strain CCMP2283" /LENGTH=106 /DNA_ID=CAMNT_0009250795 /DNA_START=138 /DNA_END=458 /DNA_ORIENTATION=+